MTLKPEATSMLSLFCEIVCVLAQLSNSAVHPAAIIVRKISVFGFIDSDLPWYQIDGTFAILDHIRRSLISLSFRQIRTSALAIECWAFGSPHCFLPNP